MAENEIPRWAQAALERNQRIQSKARSAVALMKLMEEQDRLSRLAPDTLGTVDPNYSEEVRYEAPGAIRDPESWLNRGLETLAGNAADVILGRPSENPVVDYGVANIPGVGAAAILGAGGQPGLVDAAGLGAFFGGLGRIAKSAAKEAPKSAVAMFKGLGALTPKQVAELEAARQRGKVPDITDPRHLPVVPYEMERMVLPEERTLEEAADAIVDATGGNKYNSDIFDYANALRQYGVKELTPGKTRELSEILSTVTDANNMLPDVNSGEGKKIIDALLGQLYNRIPVVESRAERKLKSPSEYSRLSSDIVQALNKYKTNDPAAYTLIENINGANLYGQNTFDYDKAARASKFFASAQPNKNTYLQAGDIDNVKWLFETLSDPKRFTGSVIDEVNDLLSNQKLFQETRQLSKNAEKSLAEFKRRQNQFTKKPEKALAEAQEQGISLEEWLGKPEGAEYNKQAQKLLEKYASQPAPKVEPVVEPVAEPVAVVEVPKKEVEYADPDEFYPEAFIDDEAEAIEATRRRNPNEALTYDLIDWDFDPDVAALAKARKRGEAYDIARVADNIIKDEPTATAKVLLGGPNKWRENGWSSERHNPDFYRQFGRDLNEESKRDIYVADSLAKHWANQLAVNPAFRKEVFPKRGEPDPTKIRQSARHNLTNYETISREFQKDLARNILSGNAPGKALKFRDRLKPDNTKYGYKDYQIVLEPEEHQVLIGNSRIWPDDQEGPSIYDLLFRPRVERKLNEANDNYWESTLRW